MSRNRIQQEPQLFKILNGSPEHISKLQELLEQNTIESDKDTLHIAKAIEALRNYLSSPTVTEFIDSEKFNEIDRKEQHIEEIIDEYEKIAKSSRLTYGLRSDCPVSIAVSIRNIKNKGRTHWENLDRENIVGADLPSDSDLSNIINDFRKAGFSFPNSNECSSKEEFMNWVLSIIYNPECHNTLIRIYQR
jgi:hypothetical protein